jgi:hypothetical protein
LMTKHCKILQLKKSNLFDQNCYLFIPRPPCRRQSTWEAFSTQKRTSSTFKTWTFFTKFYICPLDPDTADQINADPCGSGSQALRQPEKDFKM